jgi:glycosyltransferase involved in cell wall biosynthesis
VTQPPLNVVLVGDHAYNSGGVTSVVFDSAIGLKKAGHRPIVFAAAGPVDPRLKEADVETVCLDQYALENHPLKVAAFVQGIRNGKAIATLRDLLGGLSRHNSVVHMHSWAKATSPAVAGAIRESGLPAVYTLHDYFLMCPTGGFFNYPGKHVCALEPMSAACLVSNCDARNSVRKAWRCMRQFAIDHVFHLPDVFSDYVYITQFQVGAVGRYLPKGARTHVVSNPIGSENLGPKPSPADGDFVFVGRLSPEKGPLVFAEAARRAGVTPVFVGDGPMRDEIQTAYPEARLTGWKTVAEARAAMRAARVLVFPSLWWEAQGLTAFEAKALGTPVIVSEGCAAAEAVEHGVSGLRFRTGDADSLAEALRALKDDSVVARMSAAAHASYWADPPDLDRHLRAIVAIYRDMLARKAAT